MTRSPRPYRKPTPERLANIALYYLSRFAASEAGLRRVLENRIRRACLQDPALAEDDAAQAKLKEAIEAIIIQHKKTGALNDAAYAETKVRAMRRAGGSRRKITLKLQQKGVDKKLVEQALDAGETGDSAEDEKAAALAFARRRRMGPFAASRSQDPQEERAAREKACAALARAGFSYDVICAVLEDDGF